MAEGRPIVDVGPYFEGRKEEGKGKEAYEMERRLTKNYPGYQKAFERSGESSTVKRA